jgi:hypothetical protein
MDFEEEKMRTEQIQAGRKSSFGPVLVTEEGFRNGQAVDLARVCSRYEWNGVYKDPKIIGRAFGK